MEFYSDKVMSTVAWGVAIQALHTPLRHTCIQQAFVY